MNFLVIYLTGYHAAIKPMITTTKSTAIISDTSIFTGYASIIKVPLPTNLISLNLICRKQIKRPVIKPAIAPNTDIDHPSYKKTFLIVLRSVPRLLSVDISNFFSNISIVSEPMTLKEATISMKIRIRKITYFSACIVL